MNPVRQLIRVQHGSHLYGTNTPAYLMKEDGSEVQ